MIVVLKIVAAVIWMAGACIALWVLLQFIEEMRK